jgi:hypothetical protein
MRGYVRYYYEAGNINAIFRQDHKSNYIILDIRMDGDITTTTGCHIEEDELTEAVKYQKESVECALYMFDTCCPFADFIRFLEAITLDVQECSIHWDAEGPEAEMRWERRHINDTGFLTVDWSSDKNSFNHRMMLNTKQTVKMLYTAFRSFVESKDYDPLCYEAINNGDSYALVISDASLDDLSERLVKLDANIVETTIQQLNAVSWERCIKGTLLSYPIEYFFGGSDAIVSSSEKALVIQPEWDSWNIEQRRANLNSIYDWRFSMNYWGDNLRQLRSTLIEKWLALPEPLTNHRN